MRNNEKILSSPFYWYDFSEQRKATELTLTEMKCLKWIELCVVLYLLMADAMMMMKNNVHRRRWLGGAGVSERRKLFLSKIDFIIAPNTIILFEIFY